MVQLSLTINRRFDMNRPTLLGDRLERVNYSFPIEVVVSSITLTRLGRHHVSVRTRLIICGLLQDSLYRLRRHVALIGVAIGRKVAVLRDD